MPQLLAAVIVYAFPATATVVVGTITVASLIATVVVVAGTMAYSAAQKKKAEDQGREAFNASQVDRMANIVATAGPREMALGRVRKGGVVGFRGSAGSLKDKFLLHLSIADHEIDAVEEIYLNDKKVNLDELGRVTNRPYFQTSREMTTIAAVPVTGSVTVLTDKQGQPIEPHLIVVSSIKVIQSNGQPPPDSTDVELTYTLSGNELTITDSIVPSVAAPAITFTYIVEHYYAQIWWQLGSDNEVADARTKVLFPDLITNAHRGRGVAKLIAEFTFNETAFPTGMVQLTAQIRGAKLFDPRTGVTQWSENVALQMRHVYSHPWFGKATVSADEDERFKAAANACDTTFDYAVGASVENRPLYCGALVVQYGANASMVLDDLAQAMAGMWDYAGGEIFLRAGVWTNPVITLTDDDVAAVSRIGDSESSGVLSISPHRPRVDKFNVINARIWDEDQDYKDVALAPIKGDLLIARDGQELAQPFTFPAVSYHRQAQHVAGVLMRDARDPLTTEIPFKMRAFPIELFDTIRFVSARYGWPAPGKTFIVRRRVWFPDRGIVTLTMKETTASIFTPNASFLPQGRADNTALPSPWDIEPPTFDATDVFSGTNELILNSDGTILTAVRVVLGPINDARVSEGGHIDVSWRYLSAGSKWRTVTIGGDDEEATIVGVRDKRIIAIRARSRNAIAVSDWSETVYHKVVGKTEPPARVSAPMTATADGEKIRVEWPDEPEPDFAFYEVRSTDSGFGTAGFLYRGRSPSARLNPPAAGVTANYYVRKRDRSGNYSALSRSVSFGRVAPLAPGAITARVSDTSTTVAQITFKWPDASDTAFGLRHYHVTLTPADGVALVRDLKVKSNEWTTDYDWVGNATIAVSVVDRAGAEGPASTLVRAKSRPSNVGVVTSTVDARGIRLDWDAVPKTSLPIAGYEVRATDAAWGSNGHVWRGQSSRTPILKLVPGASNSFYIRAFDTDGRYSSASVAVVYVWPLPAAPGAITARVSDTSTTIAQITFNWPDASAGAHGLRHYKYKLTRPDSVQTVYVKSSEWTMDYDWLGNATLDVSVIDLGGVEGPPSSLTRSKSRPANPGAMTKVVDKRNIRLDWPENVKTSLPIAFYEIRAADAAFGSDGYLWRGPSSKTPPLRMTPGVNDFYMKPCDTDGRYSLASSFISHTFDIPATLTAIDATKRRRERVVITVSGPSIPSDLKHFEFQILKDGAGDVWVPSGVGLTDVIRSQTPTIRWAPTGFGTFRVSVRMVDIDNNVSAASISTSFTVAKIPLA